MKQLRLSARLVSDAVWRRILEDAAFALESRRGAVLARLGELDALRRDAQYDTGSVSAAAAWGLYALAHFWRPATIVEVGTFIGRSTLALAMGAEDAGVTAEIHTCDASNRIELPPPARATIIQYPGQSSTDMLRTIRDREPALRFELAHLDGRLQADDAALLARACTDDAVVALDDFEGIEKGVANAVALRGANWLDTRALVYPPSAALTREFGFVDVSTTALLVPRASLLLTAQ